MSIFELLFGFQGRISRSQWWLGQLALAGIMAVFFAIWSGWIANNGLTGEMVKTATPGAQMKVISSLLLVFAIISSALVWMGFSLAIKRVHDRSRSGWWALAYGVPLLLVVTMPNTGSKIAAILAAVWYIFELGCLKGEGHHNQYGPATTPDSQVEPELDPLDFDLAENVRRASAKVAAARRAHPGSRLVPMPIELSGESRISRFGRRAT